MAVVANTAGPRARRSRTSWLPGTSVFLPLRMIFVLLQIIKRHYANARHFLPQFVNTILFRFSRLFPRGYTYRPLVNVAFTAHYNVPGYYYQLKEPSAKRPVPLLAHVLFCVLGPQHRMPGARSLTGCYGLAHTVGSQSPLQAPRRCC